MMQVEDDPQFLRFAGEIEVDETAILTKIRQELEAEAQRPGAYRL